MQRNELGMVTGDMNGNSNFVPQNNLMNSYGVNSNCDLNFILPNIQITQGSMIMSDGSTLVGVFHGDKLYGHGLKIRNGRLEYKGDFLANEYAGEGELYYPNGNLMYKGEFSKSQYNGYGYLYYPNGILQYKGEFRNNLANGQGVLYREDGSFWYEGNLKDSLFYGHGTMIYPNGFKYIGNFHSGNPNGYGEIIDLFGTTFKGNFYNGLLNGEVTIHYANGNYGTGNMINGSLNGKCYLYDKLGNLKEAAEFTNGNYNGNGVEYENTMFGLFRKQFVCINGFKIYQESSYEESVYWDILFNPFIKFNDGKLLNAKKSRDLMIDILKNKAKYEVDIISPWINEWAVDNIFLDALKCALNRGVKVKIITGFGKDTYKYQSRKGETINNIDRLKTMFSCYLDRLSFCERNTHMKLLLCDEDFQLVGSHNMLSYNPYSPDGSKSEDDREESMMYVTDPSIIRANRNIFFNF